MCLYKLKSLFCLSWVYFVALMEAHANGPYTTTTYISFGGNEVTAPWPPFPQQQQNGVQQQQQQQPLKLVGYNSNMGIETASIPILEQQQPQRQQQQQQQPYSQQQRVQIVASEALMPLLQQLLRLNVPQQQHHTQQSQNGQQLQFYQQQSPQQQHEHHHHQQQQQHQAQQHHRPQQAQQQHHLFVFNNPAAGSQQPQTLPEFNGVQRESLPKPIQQQYSQFGPTYTHIVAPPLAAATATTTTTTRLPTRPSTLPPPTNTNTNEARPLLPANFFTTPLPHATTATTMEVCQECCIPGDVPPCKAGCCDTNPLLSAHALKSTAG